MGELEDALAAGEPQEGTEQDLFADDPPVIRIDQADGEPLHFVALRILLDVREQIVTGNGTEALSIIDRVLRQ